MTTPDAATIGTWGYFDVTIAPAEPTTNPNGTSPYEGVTAGNLETGGTLPVANRSPGAFTPFIPGLPEVTAAGREYEFKMPGPSTVTWEITRLRFVGGLTGISEGNTTLELSTTGVGGAGSSMSVSVAHTAVSGENTTGFTVAGDASIYLYVTAAGPHSDIQTLIQFEVA